MRISARDWENYISKLSKVNKKAAEAMQAFIDKNGMDDMDAVVEYAYALATKYGEASGELACEMYDAVAEASGVYVPPAEMAPTASYVDTAKAVRGTLFNPHNTVPQTVGRLVKQTGADTTLRNALRDGAKFAWIPHGETCAFCITLASRGWQNMSRNALRNGHAEHIHANCNCEYAISFDKNPSVEGYDPDYYLKIYKDADGVKPATKIKNIRRMLEEKRQNEVATVGDVSTWASDKLKRVLGSDYDAFEDLVNGSPIRALYDKYSDEGEFYYDGGGVYKNRREVHFGLESKEGMHKFSVLGHESGHMFDDKMGRLPGLSFKEVDLINAKCPIGSGIYKTLEAVPSSSDEFLSALRKDMANLRHKVRDKSIRTEFLETVAKKNATAGIQDALDGFFGTQDSGLLPWGHGGSYYNRSYNRRFVGFKNEKNLKSAYAEMGFDASNQAKVKKLSRAYEAASEAWANMSSAVTCGGEELKYMKQYMPETYKVFMSILEASK